MMENSREPICTVDDTVVVGELSSRLSDLMPGAPAVMASRAW